MLKHPRFVGPAVAVLVLAAVCLEIAAQADDRIASLARSSLSQISGDLVIPGLTANVEVIRDKWGVPHIYARNLDDLFMAQGFVVAQDRLWQMELGRRLAEGRLSELIGADGFAHDRLYRLFKFRGPWDDAEWTNY